MALAIKLETNYRSLPTFQEYILIDKSAYSVDQYIKQSDDQWSVKFYQYDGFCFPVQTSSQKNFRQKTLEINFNIYIFIKLYYQNLKKVDILGKPFKIA